MTAGAIPAPAVIPLRPPVLGKAKGLIDNQTRIELRCGHHGEAADIFFTVDGSTPDPFQPIGGGRRSTYIYEQPIVLPPGKVVLKAMAVGHDGMRTSSIVAKQFQVESSGPSPPDVLTATPPLPSSASSSSKRPPSSSRSASDNETAFLEDMKRLQAAKAKSTNATRSMIRKLLAAQRESDEALKEASLAPSASTPGSRGGGGGGGGGEQNQQQQPSGRKSILKNSGRDSQHSHYTATPIESTPPPTLPRRAFDVDLEGDGAASDQRPVDDLLRPETASAMKCSCCFTPRSHNPADRYCHTCGTELPPLIDLSSLPQQKHHPRSPQHPGTENGPASAADWEERQECPTCGMDNPPYAQACLVCEGKLLELEDVEQESPTADVALTATVDSSPVNHNGVNNHNNHDSLICPSCRKVSRLEGASFCNICGLRLQSMTTLLQCRSCGRNNEPCARFCFHCGRSLAAGGVGREAPKGQLLQQHQAQQRHSHPHEPSSHFNLKYAGSALTAAASESAKQPPKLRTVGTQSLGLYFPSQAELQRRMEEAESKVKADLRWEQKTHHPLTMTSPGRGFWRKQMDHVCAHLRHYAARDADFRCAAAQPRLGKILQTHLSEFRDTFSITLTFQRVDDGGSSGGGGNDNKGGRPGMTAAHAAAAASSWKNAAASSSPEPNLASGRSSRFTSESTINLDSSRHFTEEEEEEDDSLFSTTDDTESVRSTPYGSRRSRKSAGVRKSYTFPARGGGGGGGSRRISKSPRKSSTAPRGNSSRNSSATPRKMQNLRRPSSSASNQSRKVSLEIKGVLMEVGAGGKGRRGVVENFVAEAEENRAGSVAAFATVKDGLSLLHVAAKNMRADCVAPLVFGRGGGGGSGGGGEKEDAEKAADGDDDAAANSRRLIDVNVKTVGVGTSGNAPLHLAVIRGVDGLETAEALIDAGANIRQKNNKNLTPYDLAVKSGCEQMWTLLAAKEGQKMLRKLTKTSNNEKNLNVRV